MIELDDVRRLLAEATPGPWDNTFYCKRDGSPIETIEDIREIVAGSVDYSARTELFGVSLQDADDDGLCTVICYTGNGPNAHNNARLIAAAPTIAAAYIEQAATIARLTAERDRLREAVEYADGCFEAALAEGWLDALANHDDYSIDSIWRRRIGMARDKFPAALKEG